MSRDMADLFDFVLIPPVVAWLLSGATAAFLWAGNNISEKPNFVLLLDSPTREMKARCLGPNSVNRKLSCACTVAAKM